MTDPNRDRMAVAADWETFYDTKGGYSLTTMSPQNYCSDERFDPYLVALCGFDIFEPENEWEPNTVHRVLEDGRQLYIGRGEKFHGWSNFDNRIICCHNCGFDSVVFDECWKRGMLPRIVNPEWKCTADLSAYLMAPRNLKGAMKVLFGKEISKEVRAAMDGRHDYDLTAKEYRDLVEYGGSDAVECHDLWLKYSSEWPEMERKISDQKRNAIKRGVHVDREYCEAALKELRSYQSKVELDIPWTSQINPKTKQFYATGSLPALRQAVVDLGIEPPKSFKKDDPGFLDWLKDHEDIAFIKARQKAVAINMHSARIEGILKSLDADGDSHPQFLYYGAHTGRDSGKSSVGSSNVNMLNMPRKPVLSGDENVFGGKGVDIRGMYRARPGYRFVTFDYSQVEARFSLWLVDDTHMMAAVKEEGNLYGAAAVMMGWCKPHSNIKKTDPDMYRLAKCCLAEDSMVLVRSERKDGSLTSPRYKRIIQLTTSDKVWDGSEWVGHLGVSKMKEVHEDELSNIGGVWATDDHKVYSGENEIHQLGDLLEEDKAAAVSWGQSTNPVQGWAHVRILATALAGLVARTVGIASRKAVRLLARKVSMHGVRNRSDSRVAQRKGRAIDPMQDMRPKTGREDTREERVGEGSR